MGHRVEKSSNSYTKVSSRGNVVDLLGGVGSVLCLHVEVGPQLQQPAELARLDQLHDA